VNIIASADAAINAEDFDALMAFYAEDATLVIEPGRWVTCQTALREAFIASLSILPTAFASLRRRCSPLRGLAPR
jgi:ketosteroid isomerase-like protein